MNDERPIEPGGRERNRLTDVGDALVSTPVHPVPGRAQLELRAARIRTGRQRRVAMAAACAVVLITVLTAAVVRRDRSGTTDLALGGGSATTATVSTTAGGDPGSSNTTASDGPGTGGGPYADCSRQRLLDWMTLPRSRWAIVDRSVPETLQAAFGDHSATVGTLTGVLASDTGPPLEGMPTTLVDGSPTPGIPSVRLEIRENGGDSFVVALATGFVDLGDGSAEADLAATAPVGCPVLAAIPITDGGPAVPIYATIVLRADDGSLVSDDPALDPLLAGKSFADIEDAAQGQTTDPEADCSRQRLLDWMAVPRARYGTAPRDLPATLDQAFGGGSTSIGTVGPTSVAEGAPFPGLPDQLPDGTPITGYPGVAVTFRSTTGDPYVVQLRTGRHDTVSDGTIEAELAATAPVGCPMLHRMQSPNVGALDPGGVVVLRADDGTLISDDPSHDELLVGKTFDDILAAAGRFQEEFVPHPDAPACTADRLRDWLTLPRALAAADDEAPATLAEAFGGLDTATGALWSAHAGTANADESGISITIHDHAEQYGVRTRSERGGRKVEGVIAGTVPTGCEALVAFPPPRQFMPPEVSVLVLRADDGTLVASDPALDALLVGRTFADVLADAG